MADTVSIGNSEIGEHTRCYVVAETGYSYGGSVEKRRELFREAQQEGAHAGAFLSFEMLGEPSAEFERS